MLVRCETRDCKGAIWYMDITQCACVSVRVSDPHAHGHPHAHPHARNHCIRSDMFGCQNSAFGVPNPEFGIMMLVVPAV